MASTSPKLGLKYGWTLGENGWNTDMDNNIKKMEALVQLAVESATTTAPPGSPTAGQIYIVPAAATGAWSTNVGKVAQFIDSAWVYYTPNEGWRAWVKDTDTRMDYTGTAWINSIPIAPSYTTATRPTGTAVGSNIFDSTLGKPIWHKGSNVWVDATGATV